MKKIQLLDCTLRDGGYVNDWNFGYSTIRCIFDRLVLSGVDMIEIGFLDDRRPFDFERSIQPDTKSYDIIFEGCNKGNSLMVAMIDYGTCAIENIAPCEETCIDAIRVIFKLPKMAAAVEYAHLLLDKGYKVFLQLVSITSYSDRDILDFVDLVNELNIFGVSMVDTYGLMHKEEMIHYFDLLNHNLRPEIIVGYHSHNNFQLGYSNEVEMLERRGERPLVVDGTVYGIGKSAGNAPLELLAMYLNENHGAHYDIDQILEIIDVNVMKIFKETPWGYSLLYFLAASNDCHPSYIAHLIDKKTLSIKAINTIVGQIAPEHKLNYKKEHVEELYAKHQIATIEPNNALNRLREKLSGRNILLVGPGRSLLTHADTIGGYIRDNDPLIISANTILPERSVDFVFLSNSKRYNMLYRVLSQEDQTIIATSNVTSAGKPFDYIVKYEDLIAKEEEIRDNAFIMLLHLMVSLGIQEVSLAGFDGFKEHSSENYYNDYMRLSSNYDRLQDVNLAIARKLVDLKPVLNTVFVTPSLYETGDA